MKDDTLEAIEAEMRALGIWDAKEGTFEHWLQHHLSAPGLYDRAHEEWVKWGPVDDAPEKLLVLLQRLDRLHVFHPTIQRFGHFTTNESKEQGGFHVVYGRTFQDRFASAEIRRVAWQIEMTHAPRARMLEMILDWTMVRLDQPRELFAKGIHRTNIPGDWKEMAFSSYWGWNEPGHWPIGRYRTTVSYSGAVIAEGEFEIV